MLEQLQIVHGQTVHYFIITCLSSLQCSGTIIRVCPIVQSESTADCRQRNACRITDSARGLRGDCSMPWTLLGSRRTNYLTL